MQIYLQKDPKKRARRIRIITLFTLLCIILTASALIKKNTDTNHASYQGVLYALESKTDDTKESINISSLQDDGKKMNKESSDYSFYGKNTEKTAGGGINISSNIRVLCNDGTTRIMDMEQYVLGCLLAEMPLGFEAQALMAQSIAIRSFTARKTLVTSPSHPDADVCTDYRCCQSFMWTQDKKISETLLQKAEHAVNSTRGIIAVFDSQPIEAVYHASSGYSTASSKEVWGGDIAYLKAVSAPDGEAELTKKESTISYRELSTALSGLSDKAVSCGSFGEKINIFEADNKLCESITIDGENYSKSALKSVLSLTSSDFSLEKKGENLKITCFGNGHRVGMSQHGANLLAKEGKSYAEILKYYYTGISLCFINRDV